MLTEVFKCVIGCVIYFEPATVCWRYTFLSLAVVKKINVFILFSLFIKIKNVGNIIIATEKDLSVFCFDARQSIHPLK